MSSLLGQGLGGGFPIQTGFGPTNIPGGFSNVSTGTPGITGFGFPPPFVDPSLFFFPNASSFFLNTLLGASAGIAVPINFGPPPANLGIPPLLLGFPLLGGTNGNIFNGGQNIFGNSLFGGANPFGSIGSGTNGLFGGLGGANPFGGITGSPLGALGGLGNPFGGLGGGNIFGTSGFLGGSGNGIPTGTPTFGTLGGFNGLI